MTWKDRLQDASFRGVPFKVEEESAGTGRRVETHEYPNRDKPYTEDLGKVTFRPSITAYVVGDDCFDQRDRLIEALNKPGPGTLVHPTYGEVRKAVAGNANDKNWLVGRLTKEHLVEQHARLAIQIGVSGDVPHRVVDLAPAFVGDDARANMAFHVLV